MTVAAWQIWVLAGLLLALAELFGAQFVMVALGAAALVVGAVVALWPGLSLNGQLALFAVLAAAFIPALIVLYRRTRTRRAAGLVGESGAYLDRRFTVIRRDGRLGIVVDGDFYPASLSDDRPPPEGAAVRIEGFRGITALVVPLDSAVPSA